MEKGYCKFCEKMVKGTGDDGRRCPKHSSFLALAEPQAKKDTSESFTTGFHGLLTPEENLRFERLHTAGLVKDASEVMRRGLMDLESGYLTTPKEQPNQQSNDNFDSSLEAIQKGLLQKIQIENLRDMGKSGQPSQESGRMNMREMMEMNMMQNMMKQGGGENAELTALKSQIQMMQQQQNAKDQDIKFQMMISKIESGQTTSKDSFEQIRSLEKEHQATMDKSRMESQALRDKAYENTLIGLQTEIHKKSKANNWNDQLQDMFSEKAMDQLKKAFEKGLAGGQPEKSGGELIADVISKTTETLQPAITQWMASRQPQEPQYYSGPLPAAETQTETPEDMPEINPAGEQPAEPGPTEETNDSFDLMPLKEYKEEESGNVISRLQPKNDAFSNP